MLRFDVITIFPEVIAPYAEASILGKAQKKKLLKVQAHDLRKFSKNKHRSVDDTPYGGGAGMVMMVQPFEDAILSVTKPSKLQRLKSLFRPTPSRARIVLTAASGKRFTQADAQRLATYDQVVFLCGRYEGVDQRVEEGLADEALSIGDYVLTGGELPALVMIDAIARNIPGVLGNEDTLKEESHGSEGLLEYPQYTKPESYTFKNQQTLDVPAVLLSGNHQDIKRWRQEGMKSQPKTKGFNPQKGVDPGLTGQID